MQARNEQRLPHAILLTGHAGMGKLSFALAFVRSLLCLSAEAGEACGSCQSCQLFASSTHPDLHLVAPEEAGKAIKVDQIREMAEKNSLTAHIASFKVHLIVDAEQMNVAASNSLLKTLEEPSPNSIIILITAQPELLSATIKSRCQQMHFSQPDPEQAEKWLKEQSVKADPDLLLAMAQGAPRAALLLDQQDIPALRDQIFNEFGKLVFGKNDPISVAQQWQNHDLKMLINWLTIWVIDMVRLKLNPDEPILTSADKQNGLQKIAAAFSVEQLIEMYQKQLQAGRLLNKQLNKHLLIESLLIPWVAVKT